MEKEDQLLAEKSLKQVQEWLPEWSKLQPSDLKLTRLTGITNRTYKVDHQNQEVKPKTILLRVFGHDVDGIFIDRKEETIIYESVGSQRLGPGIYGYTSEMRAEEWIDSNVLQACQMNQEYYRRKVAIHLSRFHQQNVDGIHKEPLPLQVLQKRVAIDNAIEKMKTHKNEFTKSELQKVDELMNFWTSQKEINFILDNLPKGEDSIVFSHNDLLANNVLLDKEKVYFIDFEYSSYNYRAFDMGNYFMESQIDYDYKQPPFFKKDPNPVKIEDLQDFVKYYAFMQVKKDSFDQSQEEKLVKDSEFFEEQIKDKKQQFQEVFDEIMKELPLFMMFSCYFWGIWGIVMSKNPEIEFDYVEFSYMRYQQYLEIKKQYFTNI